MKSGKGRNRTGSLYRRWQGKKYGIDDSFAKGKGVIYLKYTVAGKTVEESLRTADIKEAKKKQAEIMRPLELASEADALKQAELRLKTVVSEQDAEWKKKNPPLKLNAVFDAFLRAQNRPRSGQKTLAGYSSQFKKFHEWIQGAFPEIAYMKDVGSRQAEAYAEYLSGQKLSPSTYNQNINTLCLIFGVLMEKSYATENPFEWDRKTRRGILRRSIKAEAHLRKKRALTLDEVEKILSKATSDYRTLIMILVCTGQRRVDGVKLEWSAIDFERNVIRIVPQKMSKRNGRMVYIPLLPQLRQVLEGLKKKGRYVLPKLVAEYDHDSSVISKNINEIFTAAEIKIAKDTDLETDRAITDVGAHSLRHTFVTIARAAGLPDAFIRQITGHSSQEMVDHYTQFSEEMVASLAGKLLGSSSATPVKAPPVLIAEATKDTAIVSVETKAADIMKLVEQIKGDENAEVKAAIIEALMDLT